MVKMEIDEKELKKLVQLIKDFETKINLFIEKTLEATEKIEKDTPGLKELRAETEKLKGDVKNLTGAHHNGYPARDKRCWHCAGMNAANATVCEKCGNSFE
jgi:dsDNA-specific endonuclease/ATPase MutS2